MYLTLSYPKLAPTLTTRPHSNLTTPHSYLPQVHYEKNRKLKVYPGNLSDFVKLVPEAASYYKLESDSISFNFPVPGMLEVREGSPCPRLPSHPRRTSLLTG